MTGIVPDFRRVKPYCGLPVRPLFRIGESGSDGATNTSPSLTAKPVVEVPLAMIPPSGVLRAIQARTGGVA